MADFGLAPLEPRPGRPASAVNGSTPRADLPGHDASPALSSGVRTGAPILRHRGGLPRCRRQATLLSGTAAALRTRNLSARPPGGVPAKDEGVTAKEGVPPQSAA